MLVQSIIYNIRQEQEFIDALKRKSSKFTDKELFLVYRLLTGKYEEEVAQLSASESVYLFKHLCEVLL